MAAAPAPSPMPKTLPSTSRSWCSSVEENALSLNALWGRPLSTARPSAPAAPALRCATKTSTIRMKPACAPISTARMGESGPRLTRPHSGYKIRSMSSNDPAKVRVRFAPSPTGLLHIGGLRSALFNWLWARHTGGTFVLRIEDTDRARLVEGAEEQIYASLDLLGITPDEGPVPGGSCAPYTQSERREQGIYQQHADQLVKSGSLYPCWCSSERLAKLREEAH